jgi:septal ring-binding cell division protein DamX
MRLPHSLKILMTAMTALGLAACANQGAVQKSAQTNHAAQGAYVQVKHKALGLNELQAKAQEGDADAQYTLGYRYYYGIGVKQNMKTSVAWFRQAGSQGQTQARQALTLIRQADRIDAQGASASRARATARSATQGSSASSRLALSRSRVAATRASAASTATAASGGFTLQLMGTHDKKSLVDFIMANKLQDKATYYRRTIDGQDWYVLVSGRFASQQEAVEAIGRLPQTVRSMNPWVKPLGLVKKEMQS